MSYSICRIAKVKASGVTGIQIHDHREKEGISHTNKDIDWNKTKENVDLLEQQDRFRAVVSNRIKQLNLPKAIRKDATVMCQCLVTSDNAFFDKMSRQEQTEYFKKSLDFIENRYGKENMVSATIHYDEQTPHMHVNFVPVTKDGRLSAKDLFSPSDLRKLQDDYNRMCRENGHDLQRGEIHSNKKHLSVEEYKIETRYNELKDKKAELEKLEKIDKSANLKAEKGKITYSTKEVEAIKEQNRALKVSSYEKDNKIDSLERKVQNLQNSLYNEEKELDNAKLPLEHLKDLESENRALQAYVEKRPSMQKDIQTFENRKENAYRLGNNLVELKKNYQQTSEERHKSIEKTYTLERKVNECSNSIVKLQQKQDDMNTSWERYSALEERLKEAQGIFKGKQRKEIKEEISKEENTMQKNIERLKAEYGIAPEQIPKRIDYLQEKKIDLQRKKDNQVQYTNKCEQLQKQIVNDYKYTKSLSNVQDKDFREISNRHDERTKLSFQDEKSFRISKEDRNWILDRMKEQNPNCIERCKENFSIQDQQKTMGKTKNMNKSKDFGMER